MATWTQGVPYTDSSADQVTVEVRADVDEVAQEDANRLASLGLDPEIPTAGDHMQLVGVNVDDQAVLYDFRDLMLYVWGSAAEHEYTDTANITLGFTSCSGNKATAMTLNLPHLPIDGSASWHPVRISQTGAGQVTIAGAAAAALVTTGTGANKTRAQYAFTFALPLTDFSGTTVWCLTGDTAFVGAHAESLNPIPAATSVTTGDGKLYWRVPARLNGRTLSLANAAVFAKSTSGTPTIQIARGRQASATAAHTFADMLSTRITIDANEFDSTTAAAPPVIDAANAGVATGDLIRIDVDVAGTGTTGLFVSLEFT